MSVIGKILIQAAHEYLELSSGVRNLSLSGREDVVKLYERYGYKIYSWKVLGYTGFPDLDLMRKYQIPDTIKVEDGKDESHLAKILDYDAQLYPYDRRKYMKGVMQEKEMVVKVALEGEAVVGYAVLSPSIEGLGYHIGPLYAESTDIAKALMREVCLAKPEVAKKGVFMEGAEPNDKRVEFEEFSSVKIGYKLQKMFTKHEMALPLQKVFSLANTDLHVM